jgi:hypothetical protein
MYRNKELLRYARHCECQHCFLPFMQDTVVAAHSNQLRHGKGMGIKAHDCFIAYLCCRCHDIVDGRALPNLDQSTRERIWNIGHQNTLNLLIGKTMLDQEAMELLHQSGSL